MMTYFFITLISKELAWWVLKKYVHLKMNKLISRTTNLTITFSKNKYLWGEKVACIWDSWTRCCCWIRCGWDIRRWRCWWSWVGSWNVWWTLAAIWGIRCLKNGSQARRVITISRAWRGSGFRRCCVWRRRSSLFVRFVVFVVDHVHGLIDEGGGHLERTLRHSFRKYQL